MSSAVTTEHATSILKQKGFDFDPGVTTAVDVGWEDMRDFEWLLVMLFRSVGVASVTSFAILGNSDSSGSGTDVNIKSHAIGTAPNAVGDQIFLEMMAAELPPLNPAGASLRHVSGSIALVAGTDECVVVYTFGGGKFSYQNLTADIIA